jgi:hypothetical protein
VEQPAPLRKLEVIAHVSQSFAVVLSFAAIGASFAFARAWSYHYEPSRPEPSPPVSAAEASITQATAAAEQLSTAQLLKRTIVSDLALVVQEQGGRSDKAYAEQSNYLLRQLAFFDRLNVPGALGVFADLTGYYLGASGEELYNCLSLRKGKALKPYLEKYLRQDNAECAQGLGQSFTKASAALGGYALCPSSEQQKVHLRTLLGEINSSKNCSDSNLAAAAGAPRPSPADNR